MSGFSSSSWQPREDLLEPLHVPDMDRRGHVIFTKNDLETIKKYTKWIVGSCESWILFATLRFSKWNSKLSWFYVSAIELSTPEKGSSFDQVSFCWFFLNFNFDSVNVIKCSLQVFTFYVYLLQVSQTSNTCMLVELFLSLSCSLNVLTHWLLCSLY